MPPADATDGFELSRLRGGEWLLGGSSLVLLVSMFALPWYGLRGVFVHTYTQLGATDTTTGWDSLVVARWFILATGLLGLAAWTAQAARRAPALPVTLTVTLAPLSLIALLLLIHRVIVSEPGPSSVISLRAGAVVALAAGVGVFAGAYRSLRVDGVRPADGPGEIETVRLGARSPDPA